MTKAATLNAVDFRFLLPCDRPGPFEHVVLLGGVPGIAERLIETGTAISVSLNMARREPVDAVLAIGPERPNLREVAACLRPGGVLYFHLQRFSLASAVSRTRRLRRDLHEVGLSPVATYATRPDSQCPRVYIPLEARGALLWYLRTLQGTPDARSWLLNKTLTTIGQLNPPLLSSAAPDIAVIARKGSREPASQVPPASILADPALRRSLATNDLHMLVISGQRTIMFVFGRASTEPLAVIKIPKLASQNEATENGQQALSFVRQLDSSIASSVPEPLALLRWHENSVAVETLIRGVSLARIFDTWRTPLSVKIAGLRDAADWLSGFHGRTLLSRGPWNASDTCRWLTTPVETYQQIFGETNEERSLFERAHEYAATATEIQLPIVGQHRDFRPVNVMRNEDGQIAVLDWEGYRAGPAFCDLFHFLTTWHYSARPGLRGAKALEQLLFEPANDRVGDAIHEVVTAYLSDLQLHPSAVPLLVVYMLLELALRRGEQQARHGDEDFRRGNENVALLNALAAHREELYGRPRAGSLLSRLGART